MGQQEASVPVKETLCRHGQNRRGQNRRELPPLGAAQCKQSRTEVCLKERAHASLPPRRGRDGEGGSKAGDGGCPPVHALSEVIITPRRQGRGGSGTMPARRRGRAVVACAPGADRPFSLPPRQEGRMRAVLRPGRHPVRDSEHCSSPNTVVCRRCRAHATVVLCQQACDPSGVFFGGGGGGEDEGACRFFCSTTRARQPGLVSGMYSPLVIWRSRPRSAAADNQKGVVLWRKRRRANAARRGHDISRCQRAPWKRKTRSPPPPERSCLAGEVLDTMGSFMASVR